MGAWNATPFGNDTALDWVQDLVGKGTVAIERPLRKLLAARRAPDAPASEEAVAAASFLAAASRQPPGKLPDEARDWLVANGFSPSHEQLKLARDALERVAAGSELLDLWTESGRAGAWKRGIAKLLADLAAALDQPPLTRTPRKPRDPSDLTALLRRVAPDETGERRMRVRRMLAAITDVNAPLPYTVTEPPLCLVAGRGLLEEAAELLDRGANVDAHSGMGYGPLAYAAAGGHAAVVDLFLRRGANTAVSHPMAPSPAWRGTPGLFAAASVGSIATLEAYDRHGVSLHQQDFNGETLMHKAAEGLGKPDVIRWLVQRGLAVGQPTTSYGSTPLHYAVRAGRPENAAVLLDLGADVNAVDRINGTPLGDVARRGSAMEKLLVSRGGKLASELA